MFFTHRSPTAEWVWAGLLAFGQMWICSALPWLFNALHSWDVPVLRSRPLWDGWMIIASVLGIGLGVTSLVVGGKRLARSWPWRRIR